jgi:hypothetical protein
MQRNLIPPDRLFTPSPHSNNTVRPADPSLECFQQLLREFNPVGFSETQLTRAAARYAAEMLKNEQLSVAIETQGASALATLMLPMNVEGGFPVALCVPDRMTEILRAGIQSSNAFYRVLVQLTELQRRRAHDVCGLHEPDPRFYSEVQCTTYLARRFQFGIEPCRGCGVGAKGSWIAIRRAWQCAQCGTQTCARQGTVMARSRVPLNAWFHAIRNLLFDPSATTAELASAIGIRRAATIRTMIGKIHAAMLADNASILLAGLDEVFLPMA